MTNMRRTRTHKRMHHRRQNGTFKLRTFRDGTIKSWWVCAAPASAPNPTADHIQSHDGTGLRVELHGTPGSGDLRLFVMAFYASWKLDKVPSSSQLISARIEITTLNQSAPFPVNLLARNIDQSYEGTLPAGAGGWQEGDNGVAYTNYLLGLTFDDFGGSPPYTAPPTFNSPNLGHTTVPASTPPNVLITIPIDPGAISLIQSHFGTQIPFTAQVSQTNNSYDNNPAHFCPPPPDTSFWEREQACPPVPPQTAIDPGYDCDSDYMATLVLFTL